MNTQEPPVRVNIVNRTLKESGPLKRPIRVGSVSDIHFNHPNTETPHIIESLDTLFTTQYVGTLDVLIIAGDVFDSLMNTNDDNYFRVKDFIDALLRRCVLAQVSIIVLEGTPSHDWKQSRVFTYVNEMHQINAALYYVDTLDIISVRDVGKDKVTLSVLCVPDEWRPNPDDTWMEVTALLSSKGLSKVDVAIMHGCFTYQLPSHSNAPKHIEERYLGIVRYFISIGHHHIMSFKDRIFVQGSPERLKHNEEGSKGILDYTVSNTSLVVDFIENKKARIYRTFDCRKRELDDAASWIESELQALQYPPRTRVRLQAAKGSPVLSLYSGLKEKYGMYHWSVDTDDMGSTTEAIKGLMREVYTQVNISNSNIVELTRKWLDDNRYETDLIDSGVGLLEEILNGNQ